MISNDIQDFLLNTAVDNFLRYVRVWTTSDMNSSTHPTSEIQLDLAKLLATELKEIGLENVIQDKYGYVYANLPASEGLENVQPIGFIAHLDTAPSVSGKDVKPVIHKSYDGQTITYASNNQITLSPEESPNLNEYIGLDIITSEGDTLLGADDKAGIAEIMATCSAWKKFSELKHGPITICFTPDEEVGKGTLKIDKKKLPEFCYTLDGSEMGELELECFDAWRAIIKFKGINIHPGHAKNLLINAIHIACRFLSDLPEAETPENTEDREGFFHLGMLKGSTEEATATLLIRDYKLNLNQRRMDLLKKLKEVYEIRYPGLKIDLSFQHQYQNMLRFLEKYEKVINLAKKAIEKSGLEVKVHSIRGGTDGAKLSEMGIPTPNIFTGGQFFHSKKEYIPTLGLQKAAEVIINLAELWIN